MTNTEKTNQKEVNPTSTIKKVLQKAITEKSVTLKAEEPRVRYLKLKEFYREGRYGKRKIVPELRLCGNWLEQAGFPAEDYVSVTVMNGLLIVRIVESQEEDNNEL
jgi:hypothetical protein